MCNRLLAGHVVGSRPIERKGKKSYMVVIIDNSQQSFVFYSSLGFIKDKLQATIGECDNGLSQHSLIYFPSVFFVIYNYIFLPYAQ